MIPSTQDRLLLRADRMILPDLGRVTEDQQILVEDSKIAALVPRGTVPGNARIFDLPGCTLLPGLIDCHTHLTLPSEIGEILDELRRSPAECALESIPNVRDKLLSGFTTVREAGSYWALVDVAVRNAIDSNIIAGPKMYVPAAMVTMTGGAGAMGRRAQECLSWSLTMSVRCDVCHGPATPLNRKACSIVER